jgi:hypothetical protein
MNASFLIGLLDELLDELDDFVTSEGIVIGASIAEVLAPGAASTLLPFLPIIAAIIRAIRDLLERAGDDTRFSELLEKLRRETVGNGIAGMFVWRAIYNEVFAREQGDLTYAALSYAVMDKHRYGDRCEVNVASLEVFFDAADRQLISYVDALIEFEKNQESRGRTIVGYAALRFMGSTRALIGMQQWSRTCSIEVSCLRDVLGGDDLLEYAMTLARDRNLRALLHWGQNNDCSADEIAVKFDRLAQPDRLRRWQAVLADWGGECDRYSNVFTRRAGLESRGM